MKIFIIFRDFHFQITSSFCSRIPGPWLSDNATRTSFQPIRTNSSTQENERDRPSTADEKRRQQNYVCTVVDADRTIDLNCATSISTCFRFLIRARSPVSDRQPNQTKYYIPFLSFTLLIKQETTIEIRRQ